MRGHVLKILEKVHRDPRRVAVLTEQILDHGQNCPGPRPAAAWRP